jgi:ATP-dependent exoDNAse (exonuclease V) beta subunit
MVEQLCSQMSFRLSDIAVLARKKDKVNHLRGLLSRAGMPVVHFRDEGFDIFENSVKAVTISSAKGLEFPVVFLADLDEGDLPRYLPVDDEDELQSELRSERRLLYVGMTRAASRLYLVCRQGQSSRFLDEIDPDTVQRFPYEGVTEGADQFVAG